MYRYTVNLPDSHKRAVETAAKRAHRSVSNWTRELIEERLGIAADYRAMQALAEATLLRTRRSPAKPSPPKI